MAMLCDAPHTGRFVIAAREDTPYDISSLSFYWNMTIEGLRFFKIPRKLPLK